MKIEIPITRIQILFILFTMLSEYTFAQIPTSVLQHIPTQFSLLQIAKGNLNLDRYDDYILIIKNNQETDSRPEKRRLLIIIGDKEDSWKLSIDHENLVYYYGYDKNFPESFVDVTVSPGKFTIDHYGGFRTRWSRTTVFYFEAKIQRWLLSSDLVSLTDITNPDSVSQDQIVTNTELGKIRIEDFNIYDTILKNH